MWFVFFSIFSIVLAMAQEFSDLEGLTRWQQKNILDNPRYQLPFVDSDYQMEDWHSDSSLCEPLTVPLIPKDLHKDRRCVDESQIFSEVLEEECQSSRRYVQQVCEPKPQTLSVTKRNLYNAIDSYNEIPITCVYQSMRKGIENIEDVTHWHCQSEEHSSVKGPTTCLEQKHLRYIHWVVNQGIKCAMGGADMEYFNAREVFALINHESHFIYNVDRQWGNGLMQLMAPGAMDIRPGRPTHQIWEKTKIINVEECASFANLFDSKVKTYKQNRKTKMYDCPYVHPREGIKRNVMTGLMLFRKNIAVAKANVKREWFANEEGYKQAVKIAVRTGYNRGYPTMQKALREMPPSPANKKFYSVEDYTKALVKRTKDKLGYSQKVDEDLANIRQRSLQVIEETVRADFQSRRDEIMEQELKSMNKVMTNALLHPEYLEPEEMSEELMKWLVTKLRRLQKAPNERDYILVKFAEKLAGEVFGKKLNSDKETELKELLYKNDQTRLKSFLKIFEQFEERRTHFEELYKQKLEESLKWHGENSGFNC